MLSFLQSVAGFMFIFGVVVFVHELGHFLAAKATGVYAPKFSIGFGPGPRKRFGETQYILGVIPLGGYVRMASREDDATAFLEGGSEQEAAREIAEGRRPNRDWSPDAMVPFGPKPVPEHRWFESKPLSKRLVILFAGVTMNALLTLTILIAMAACFGRTTVRSRVVGRVRDVPAARELARGVQPGDTMIAIQGQAVDTWNDVLRRMITAQGDTLRLMTSRGLVVIAAGAAESQTRQELVLALDSFVPAVIGAVVPGTPAARAGLQRGDSITAIGGRSIGSFYDLVEIVSATIDRPLEFELLRNAVPLRITVTPQRAESPDPDTGKPRVVGQIGINPRTDITHEDLSVGQAVVAGVQQSWMLAGSIVGTLRGLISRQISFRQLGGPIMIAQQSASAAQQGIDSVLYLLALLSINLAVLNLLPIPVLDGGQVLLQIAEAVKGRPFSARTRQYIVGAGVALVVLLMLVVSYNDLLRLIGR